MAERIDSHKQGRGPRWETIEAPLDVAGALDALNGDDATILIDCLTLWLTNILMADTDGFEDRATGMARALIMRLGSTGGTKVVVSNELGMGMVPDNAFARKFRDVAGKVNQMFAEAADEVYLSVSGIPVKIK